MKKTSPRGLLLVIISGIVFGLMPGAVTFCEEQGAGKLLTLLSRNVPVFLVTLPIVLRRKDTFPLFRRYWRKYLLVSALEIATGLLLYSAYDLVPTGAVTTIHFLYPSIVALLCFLVFREKLSRVDLVCLALSVVGILLMFDAGGEKLSLPGLGITLLSSLTWAVYIVVLDKLSLGETTSEQLMLFTSVDGMALTLLCAAFGGGLDAGAVTPVGWGALAATSFVLAVFGSMFFLVGVRRTSAQVSSIASTLEPITSLLVGAAFLHEPLTLRTGTGAMLILLAVILLAIFENNSEKT